MKPLKEAINSAILHSVFPNNRKRAAVTPLDKGTKDKNSVNNYKLKKKGSMLGPIIFNIFINDLFCFILNSNLHNYSDGNTVSGFSKLIIRLEIRSDMALSCLQNNKMIANPEKFHAIFLKGT